MPCGTMTKPRHSQCCWQGLETQGRGQRLENWSLRILEDKDFPRGQQHCCEAVRWDQHELEPDRAQWQIRLPVVTQSLQDDGAWYFAYYVSLHVLNPRKISRTWTSEDKNKDKDLPTSPSPTPLTTWPRYWPMRWCSTRVWYVLFGMWTSCVGSTAAHAMPS